MATRPSTTAPPWRRRGVCLTAGVHTPGSQAALECPLRHAKGVDTGSPESASNPARRSHGSNTIFRDGRADDPGGPSVT